MRLILSPPALPRFADDYDSSSDVCSVHALPDYGDEESTDLAPVPNQPAPARPQYTSHVRIKHVEDAATPVVDADRADVERFVATLGGDLTRLGALLRALDGSVERMPYDCSSRAAAATLEQRVGDIGYVRDALTEVHSAGQHVELAPLFAPDAPLGPYLKGVTIWCDGVVEALGALEVQLRQLSPDWSKFRERVAEAGQFHFTGLVEQVKEHVRRLDDAGFGGPELEAMKTALEELFFATEALAERLEHKFG